MKSKFVLVIMSVVIFAFAGIGQGELLFHWKLDDAASSAAVVDATGHGYDGTCTGTPAFLQTGQNGSSVYYDPSDGADYITLSYVPELSTPSFTLSYWMKIEDGFGAHMVPFSNGNWNPTTARDGITMLFRGDDNQMIFRMGHNFNGWYEYSVPGTRSIWYYIVITSDWISDMADYTYYDYRVVRRFYVNGVIVDEDMDDAFMPNRYDRPFSLGVRQMGATTDPAYPCTGYFDDVQYYTHALNPGTIAYMYANPGATGEIELIPDDFEVYADTAELGGYWSTAGGDHVF